jgi:hypothetical protein
VRNEESAGHAEGSTIGTRTAAHPGGAGLFLAAYQRGVLRLGDGDGGRTFLVDIGAFER